MKNVNPKKYKLEDSRSGCSATIDSDLYTFKLFFYVKIVNNICEETNKYLFTVRSVGKILKNSRRTEELFMHKICIKIRGSFEKPAESQGDGTTGMY